MDGCGDFRTRTYFDQIAANPEALAETLVHYRNGLWVFIQHNIPVIRMTTREAAVAATVEYLRQEVEE